MGPLGGTGMGPLGIGFIGLVGGTGFVGLVED